MPPASASDSDSSQDMPVDEEVKMISEYLTRMAGKVARQIAADTIPDLVKAQVEQSIQMLVPEALNAAIAGEMRTLVEQGLKTTVPALVEAAIAEERVLIK